MEKEISKRIQELTAVNAELIEQQQMTNRMKELANKDALTGVRNKAAYNSNVEAINEKIKNNENVEFGIVMVDLNDLKIINDEYGHKNGDIALIKLSNLVCGVFAHSPVFRVGGDEFVVVIQNLDYRRIETLVEEFKNKIYGLQEDEYLAQNEKISAAIGYALFDKNIDKTVEDVFARADNAMYNCKRQMKGK